MASVNGQSSGGHHVPRRPGWTTFEFVSLDVSLLSRDPSGPVMQPSRNPFESRL